jgi:hypothetical protein
MVTGEERDGSDMSALQAVRPRAAEWRKEAQVKRVAVSADKVQPCRTFDNEENIKAVSAG